VTTPTLPQRRSLVAQVSELIANEVRAGRWGEWLPEERELARHFQVSRFTLRRSLAALRVAGVIETEHGVGSRICAPGAMRVSGKVNASVGVLCPRALEGFRYFVITAVDDLKSLLFERKLSLSVHEHPQVGSRQPAGLLEKLVAQQRHACWLLVACGHETQQWFSRRQVPAVVSGTCDPSLGLPFVCLDNYALGRHAGLSLLQHGHRRIGALLTRSNPALRSGLNDVLSSRTDDEVVMMVQEVEEAVGSAARGVDRLFAPPRPPTAVFAAESSIYLTAFSRLTQLGRKVPGDVSMLCRDDEPYLAAMLPSPARYSKSPHIYAKHLLAHMQKLIDHEPLAHPGTYVMPEFLPGDSLRRL
jgi:DNA-binding LacI/PurR family transcriptional regulator